MYIFVAQGNFNAAVNAFLNHCHYNLENYAPFL